MSLIEEPSFRLIAPFLRPVMGLLDDESVSEIMVNPGVVFVARCGRLERVTGGALDHKHVRQAALAIARSQGDEISAERPLLDARLPEGFRIAALPPCSFGGPALTIRKFARRRLTLDDLVDSGSVSGPVAEEVRRAVEQRHAYQRAAWALGRVDERRRHGSCHRGLPRSFNRLMGLIHDLLIKFNSYSLACLLVEDKAFVTRVSVRSQDDRLHSQLNPIPVPCLKSAWCCSGAAMFIVHWRRTAAVEFRQIKLCDYPMLF